MNNHTSPKIFFAQVLRQLRQKENLTQEELADRVGVSTSFVGMLEVGTRIPSMEMLFRVAYALGIRPSEIVEAMEQERELRR